MYIRRKVYSVLTDDYGQERLFSTNEVCLDDYEDDYVDDRLFAERTQDALDKFKTNKGMFIGSPLARKAGVRAAEKLDRESDGRASDRVLLETAGKKGGKTGAALGATGGLLATGALTAAALATGKGRAVVKKAVRDFGGRKKALAAAGLAAGALTAGGALEGGIKGRISARRAVNDKLNQRDNASVKDYMWGKK